MALFSKIWQMIFQSVIIGLCTLWSTQSFAQADFNTSFENKTLRIDYFLSGNSSSQHFFLDELIMEPHWSGSFRNTLDELNLGTHRVEVADKLTGELIYSQGFCTLFQEWQTVKEATYLDRAFEQVTRIPFPKNSVIIKFKYRDKGGNFTELYQFEVNPQSIYIKQNEITKHPYSQIINNGNPNENLDITFIAEGYTAEQMDKFRADVMSFTQYLFNQPPFDEMKGNINIWAVESISEDEGPTNPGTGIWNTTATQSSFFTFGIDRYLTTTKYKRVMDIAANVPGDIVYIIVNTNEYGGGGIYNHYNVTTSDHELSNEVFIHELGHGLAGLADEYYTSDVAYEEFYPLHLEPWEPNISTMVDFNSKWADMIDKGTPIPTPDSSKFKSTVGVYEGAGYMHKGAYRPYIDCRMKSNSANGFCPVCQRAIKRVIETYTK